MVRSRNGKLSKLVVAEAERQLDNICSSLLVSQEYAGSVEVNIWLDHAEYVAHAADAPEWSGGSYSLRVENGLTMRRIDLTQLDDKGNFATVMIDRVLPHELCHLVVRDFFGDAACPTYLNEGLAMLAEPEADNQRVMLAGTALAGKGRVPLAQLLVQQTKFQAGAADALVFYAESYSLLLFLHGRLSQQQFRDVLSHVKAGCPLHEALQRVLCKHQRGVAGVDRGCLDRPGHRAAGSAHAQQQRRHGQPLALNPPLALPDAHSCAILTLISGPHILRAGQS